MTLSANKPANKLRLLALLALVVFLLTEFRAGWTRSETDFPGYYTAAVLLRHAQPLRNFYDWSWFQEQMGLAGIDHQLGAYAAQTPLTMLPILPLSYFPVQTAKRIWLICNLAFLFITDWMLSRVTRFSIGQIWLVAFCGSFSLYINFLYGQYYIFLLFLLAASFYFLSRGNPFASGFLAGVAFVLKLYAGPLLLFFLLKRKWKAAVGMAAAIVLLGIVALKLFHPAGIHYYLSQVLTRSLDGSPINPYSPGVSTISNMLRHWFMREPQLNPHPLWNSPALFFFLRALGSLAIVAAISIGVALAPQDDRRDFAWFIVATLGLSTSTGSYTFIVLLLPLVLLLEESRGWESAFFIACYVLMTLPARFAWLFPKVWILLFFFLGIARHYWRAHSVTRSHPQQLEYWPMFMPANWSVFIKVRWRLLVIVGALLVLIAFVDMKFRLADYASQPGQKFERIAITPALLSLCPLVTPAGLFYQALGNNQYVLRWQHDGRNEELSFDGQALCPSASPVNAQKDGSIYFGVVSHGAVKTMEFDPATRTTIPSAAPVPQRDSSSAISPDRKWIAFSSESTGQQQIWLRNAQTGAAHILTGGRCNNSSPTWELDSQSIIFASDCGRALGTPALYHAPIE